MQTSSLKSSLFSEYFGFGILLFSFLSATTLVIYLAAHVFLYANAVFQTEEIYSLLCVIGAEAVATLCVLLLLLLLESSQAKRTRFQLKRPTPKKALAAVAVFLLTVTTNAQSASGSRRDAATGMHTSYLSLTTTTNKLVMNGEVLGHSQIPLGEKFTILNEGISGLTQKGGKVSVGCSLKITDSKGNLMLQMADLYAARDVFNAADAKYLKCIVSTGKPMRWNEKYTVTAVFWDKWGDGKITNRVTIEMIDVP